MTVEAELVLFADADREAALVVELGSGFLIGLGASTPAVLEPSPSF